MTTTNQCAKCGACTAVCPVYQVTGRESLTARGRLHLLAKRGNKGGPDPELAEIFSKCLLCGACRKACPRGIDTPALIMEARAGMPEVTGLPSFKKFLLRQALARPAVLSALTKAAGTLGLLPDLPSNLPDESGLRLSLLTGRVSDLNPPGVGFTPRPLPAAPLPSRTALYFSGCLSQHLAPVIGLAAELLLERLCDHRLVVPDHQTCCGLAAKAAGDPEQARELARRAIAQFSTPELFDLPIFTTCASCYSGLKGYPDLFTDDRKWRDRALAFSDRVSEFSTFILQHGKGLADAFRSDLAPQGVVYHDPCHLRFAEITGPPRELIRQAPGLKLLELPHGPQCCGMGGLFRTAHAELSERISQNLIHDFLTTNAPLVTTTCTGCLLQWQQGLTAVGSKARATHLAILLAQQLLP